jgi:hypothetical protein
MIKADCRLYRCLVEDDSKHAKKFMSILSINTEIGSTAQTGRKGQKGRKAKNPLYSCLF